MLNNLLNSFEPISLDEMDNVKLMDRTDTKYTFHSEILPTVLEQLKDSYRVLRINDTYQSNYKTLYYDTNELSLYYKHHSGKLNRYKVRHRSYVDSNIGFLEVKFKNNKGRTIKDRIKNNEVLLQWTEEARHFLAKKTPYLPDTLVPNLWVNYSRITLVNKTSNERLTIDLNLEFIKGDREKSMKSLVIAEVKQEKNQPSRFKELMKQLRIREGSISKYCMAVALTGEQVKINSFKAKLIQLQKITQHDSITNSR